MLIREERINLFHCKFKFFLNLFSILNLMPTTRLKKSWERATKDKRNVV